MNQLIKKGLYFAQLWVLALVVQGVGLAAPAKLIFDPVAQFQKDLKQGANPAPDTASDALFSLVQPSLQKWVNNHSKRCGSPSGKSEKIRVLQTLAGSFTKAASSQKMYLYAFCEPLEYFELEGPQLAIAVVENNKPIVNFRLTNPAASIHKGEDINSNGLNEVIVAIRGQNGLTEVVLAEFPAAKVKVLGKVAVAGPGFSVAPMQRVCFSDVGKPFPQRFVAKKIWVKPGINPSFLVGSFQINVNCQNKTIEARNQGKPPVSAKLTPLKASLFEVLK